MNSINSTRTILISMQIMICKEVLHWMSLNTNKANFILKRLMYREKIMIIKILTKI